MEWLSEDIKEQKSIYTILESKEISIRNEAEALKIDRDREWRAWEILEEKIRELSKLYNALQVKSVNFDKELIIANEKANYEQQRAVRYETLYNDVNQRVEFAENEYWAMKARLEELQKVYADLKKEYDDSVETLNAVNQARNKYYEDNYFLLGKIRELQDEIRSL